MLSFSINFVTPASNCLTLKGDLCQQAVIPSCLSAAITFRLITTSLYIVLQLAWPLALQVRSRPAFVVCQGHGPPLPSLVYCVTYIVSPVDLNSCLRPYHVENTGSRPITEVKQRRARLVLGWVTAWEYRVL